ncbi:MAG: putative Ig domain-containing protein [Gammaproteobacteria bacterium]|nr:putative Ig domain-containing protein [Gammaproteobacteria bacterium]
MHPESAQLPRHRAKHQRRPEVGTPLSDLSALEDSAFSFTLPTGSFRDVDVGDALIYTATLANGDPLPDWLTFDAQTRTFSGTPANGNGRGCGLP